MKQNYIIHTPNDAAEKQAQLGGKAGNLFRLQSAGLKVPEFICISAEAYRQSTAAIRPQIRQYLDQCQFGSLDSLTATAKAIQALILSCELPEALCQALEEHLNHFETTTQFSVRSSAISEDGDRNSFAGQLGTWLNVSGADIQAKIKACWASAFEPGVLTYIHQRTNIRHEENAVAVVIQRMVHAVSSGVMFQADPQNGLEKLAIAAGYGLGEGIVGDKVETDLYLFDKPTRTWQLHIEEKQRQLRSHPGGGTQETRVQPDLQKQAVLSEQQRLALLQASDQIARIYTTWQDIEWSFDHSGQLYILQSRPITTIPAGHERVFDNCNIAESYPGIILPMTFSIVRNDYYHCMKGTMQMLGIPASVIKDREDVLQHLVGFIHGRTYYNISNWYRIFLTIPYFKQRFIHFFEQMVGTDGSFTDNLDDMPLSRSARLRTAVMFPLKLGYYALRHRQMINKYFAITAEIRRDYEAIDTDNAGSDTLIAALHQLVIRFTESMAFPLLNDFYAMSFMALTREQFARAGIADADNLINQLLGNQSVESTKPVDSLNTLITQVRRDEQLQSCLKRLKQMPHLNQPQALASALTHEGYTAFAAALKGHIERYGYRSPKELIMEASTFHENPFHLLHILLESAAQEPSEPAPATDAGPQLEAALSQSKKKRWLKWLLKKTRQAIANREATRLDRGLHFSFFRTLLHHIGHRLVSENMLTRAEDIFYLTLSELEDFRQGCGVTSDFRPLVALRKNEVKNQERKTQDNKIFTRGSVYANTIPDIRLNLQDNPDILKGVGCAGDRVSAPARIITDPSQGSDLKGRIMVSETTDPGWVFLMTMSAGLISERGSLLSHTAIIGRELGIPTVVGVKHATRYIQDGSPITLNGKTGEIHLNEAKNPAVSPVSETDSATGAEQLPA
ncbi:Phosphoenolpyruvate synthase [Vibrio aerogenes CECT 7868]|uniref:Phosphoenolpyruvate synthase n=1 Tax=Vibrio aerogenes CECT 7868 TaxID=1216006 RepID=A0A1M5Z522_9VIBR|nr:PEP/pyruvate-binding domain-containing protein [Vibrio aerogenes]SHI19352.1 Phosphoenolpyruvate synthase [Vibrio aerogenes CECT 7868]